MTSGFTKNLRSLKKRSFLGQLVVTLLSCELLFFASFISLSLPTPTKRNLESQIHNCELEVLSYLPPGLKSSLKEKFPALDEKPRSVRYSRYVPLLPLSIALAYVLGSPLVLIAFSLFLILGVCGPHERIYLFASGGGPSYFLEPGCGYLVGIICGAWLSAWICAGDERKSWRQLLSAAGGVVFTHIIGLCWVFGGSIAVLIFEGEAAYLHFQPWLAEQMRNLSWYTLPYDLLFATMLIGVAFPLRWLFNILTCPDVSHKQRPKVETQLEVLQETTV